MSPLLSNITFGITFLISLGKVVVPSQVQQYSSDCFNKYFHSAHWGLNPPPLPLFLGKSHLKSANSPSPPFLGNLPPLYGFFVFPPLKVGFFSEAQKCYSFSSVTVLSFKSN